MIHFYLRANTIPCMDMGATVVSQVEKVTCLDCLIALANSANARYDYLWKQINEAQGDLFEPRVAKLHLVERLPQKPVDLREGSEGESALDKAEAPVFVAGVCKICGGAGYITTPIMGEWTEGTKQTLCWNCGSTGKQ